MHLKHKRFWYWRVFLAGNTPHWPAAITPLKSFNNLNYSAHFMSLPLNPFTYQRPSACPLATPIPLHCLLKPWEETGWDREEPLSQYNPNNLQSVPAKLTKINYFYILSLWLRNLNLHKDCVLGVGALSICLHFCPPFSPFVKGGHVCHLSPRCV